MPDEHRVVLYELRGQDITRTTVQNRAWVTDFDWTPDGRSLAWITDGDRHYEVTVAPVSRRGEPFRPRSPKSGYPDDGPHIASHPKGSVVAFYTPSDTYLWDYGRGDAPTRIAAGFVGPLAFSPDGLRLWGVASKGCVDSWPLSPAIRATHWADTSGRLLGLLENGPLTRLEAVSGFEGLSGLTADARWVLAAGKDGRTRVLDARDGTIQAMWGNGIDFLFNPGLDPVSSVALSPDGILGASGMRSGRIWLRRVPGGEEVASLDKHQGAVDALAFQPDGRLLASGSRDGTIRLWRPVRKIWSEVLTLRAPGGPVRRLRFSPDGTKLAVLVRNETAVRIWDLASLRTRLAAMRLDWDEDERPVPEGRRGPRQEGDRHFEDSEPVPFLLEALLPPLYRGWTQGRTADPLILSEQRAGAVSVEGGGPGVAPGGFRYRSPALQFGPPARAGFRRPRAAPVRVTER